MSSNIKNTTCFNAHIQKNKSCKNKSCRYWHSLESSNNCVINEVNKNIENNSDLTLQEIGSMFNITRMRVCQIEKQILNKIKKQLNKLLP